MDAVTAVFLGLLQGVTEWLPISSQGQVMSFSISLLNIGADKALSYAIWLHMGTLLAATIYFRGALSEILTLRDKRTFRWLLLASASTGIMAFPIYIAIKDAVSSSETGLLLLAIGLMLIVSGIVQRGAKETQKDVDMGDRNAIVTGLAQGLSALPGISRSGTTVSALLLQGFSAERSFYLSFLMSIPAVFGAEIVLGIDEGFAITSWSLVAVATSFVVGYLTLERLITYAKGAKLWKFCIAFGAILVALFLLNMV